MEFILNRPLSIINKHLKIFFLWFLFSSWLLPLLPITGHRSPDSTAEWWFYLSRPSHSGLRGSVCSSAALALRNPELGGCVSVCVWVCPCVHMWTCMPKAQELPLSFFLLHSLQLSCINQTELWLQKARSAIRLVLTLWSQHCITVSF